MSSSNLTDSDWISTAYFLYRKKNGVVYLRRNSSPQNLVANTEMAIGTLPTGYRPQKDVILNTQWFSGNELCSAIIKVDTTGSVYLTSVQSNYVTVYEVSFIADL